MQPIFLFLLSLAAVFAAGHATVPASATFKLVNEGDFGDYVVEYDANYRALNIFNSPFQLCFYNTTPNAYTLALRAGLVRSTSRFFWVWEANRANPVKENATFSLGTDGNLVLADSDGRVAWQSNTANKGVVDFKLLPNGNMVLVDSKGGFVWQSFDTPTDTLLVGQYLKPNGPAKLVSRISEQVNSDGPYSLVLEPRRIAMYYKSKSSPKPLLYFALEDIVPKGSIKNVTFDVSPEEDEDGPYALGDTECQLPERCGGLGVCEDSQCVACPTPKGLLGWSKSCNGPKIEKCQGKDAKYFKVDGIDHFTQKYSKGDGPMKESECESKCTKDCKCKGYFYNNGSSRCWIAYDLMTLTKVENSTHVGYIKISG